NGVIRLAAPPALDLENVESDKKLEDEEILKILEKPLSRSTGSKNKNKKKKAAAKKEGGEEKKE
ncbi:Curved DNA-binding protein (42 kDa protein), partial [Ascosphaera atra]